MKQSFYKRLSILIVVVAMYLISCNQEVPQVNSGQLSVEEVVSIAEINGNAKINGRPALSKGDSEFPFSHWIVEVKNTDGIFDYYIDAISSEIIDIKNHPTNDLAHLAYSSYPGILLNVPFLTQVPPGDWSNTKNCGQTSVLMTMAMLNNFKPYSNYITDENMWFAWYYGDSRYLNVNGYYTNTNQLYNLVQKYWYYKNSLYGNWGTKDMLYNSLLQGKPVVVSVRIKMGTTTAGHFMVLIGMDDKTVYVHDPGTNSGAGKMYSYSTFESSWKTQNCSYLVFTTMSK